jgi:hypothetical protein
MPGAVAVHGINHRDEDSTDYHSRNSSTQVYDVINVTSTTTQGTPDPALEQKAVKQDCWHKHRKAIAAIVILLIVTIAVGVAVPLVVLNDSSSAAPTTGSSDHDSSPSPTIGPSATPSLAPSGPPWDVLGEAIVADGPLAPLISLAGTGTDLAVSDNGQIQVYRFSSDSSQWSRRGEAIEGSEAHITTDGSTMVVRKEGSNVVSVLMFDDSSDSWDGEEEIEVAPGDDIVSLAISGNGEVIAIGHGIQISTFAMNGNGVWNECALPIMEEQTTDGTTSFSAPAVHLSLSDDGSMMGSGYELPDKNIRPLSLVYFLSYNAWSTDMNYVEGSLVSVSGDGSAFASGGCGETMLRNFSSGGILSHVIKFPMGIIELVGVSLSRDGKTMATAIGNESAVWTLRELRWENMGRREHDGPLLSISLSDDGTVIAVVVDGSVPRVETYQRRD